MSNLCKQYVENELNCYKKKLYDITNEIHSTEIELKTVDKNLIKLNKEKDWSEDIFHSLISLKQTDNIRLQTLQDSKYELNNKINFLNNQKNDVETKIEELINILRDGPVNRRRFLDMMIGQLRPNYVYNLNLYLKTLEQRNNYLKQIKEENKSQDLLDIWDEKLAEYGEIIYRYRVDYVDKIIEKINDIHSKITDQNEELTIEYVSNCENKDNYLGLLKERRKLDIIKGFTTKGVHRDDFMIYINNKEVNVYGSQGQNRTAVLSLKLAELNVIYEEIGEYPILLLDDFMSELDEKRRKNFLENIKDTQVIITGTDKIEIQNVDYNLYHIKKGEIV